MVVYFIVMRDVNYMFELDIEFEFDFGYLLGFVIDVGKYFIKVKFGCGLFNILCFCSLFFYFIIYFF